LVPDSLWTTTCGEGSPVVLAHGFTHTSRSWGPFSGLLAERHEIRLVDLPGHGFSERVQAGFEDAARLLGETGGEAAYVGYSMGGRMSLRLALDSPEKVTALVLIGASPGIEDPDEREQRRREDERMAEDLEGPDAEDEGRLGAFIDRWLSLPLFRTLPRERAGISARLENTCAGLGSSLRLCGTGTQEPLWDRLFELDMPVLFMAGEHDPKYRAIGERLVRLVGPNARLAIVPDAGHACHLERPDECARLVLDFLARAR